MYKRKIERELEEWKSSVGHKPIVIKGVRQCGKTSSVLAFAKSHYKYWVYLDFRKYPEYSRFFVPNLDIDSIILRMSAAPQLQDAEFVPGETCLIFDELQDCPMARASLKYFFLDGRYDVISTGSLLGVSGYPSLDQDAMASIPVGFEDVRTMYPMDFEEFLWAVGVRTKVFDYIKSCFFSEQPVDDSIHQTMRAHLLNYIVVGGMPDAVATFINEKQYNKVLQVQRAIVDSYRADMIKYASPADKSRIVECFDSIPAQLAREYKKFSYKTIRMNSRGRDYAGCIRWIEDAGIVRRCYNLRTTQLPLDGERIDTEFKLYVADIGLLICMLEEGTQMSVLQGDLGAYKGAIYENLMADVLGKMSRRLYYFRRDTGLELDFVVRYAGECVPIECKARQGRAKSLSTVLKNTEVYQVSHAIKLGDYNVGREGALLTMPMYMSYLLTDC